MLLIPFFNTKHGASFIKKRRFEKSTFFTQTMFHTMKNSLCVTTTMFLKNSFCYPLFLFISKKQLTCLYSVIYKVLFINLLESN